MPHQIAVADINLAFADPPTVALDFGVHSVLGSNIGFTGGSIDGVIIGAVTPAAGTFSSINGTIGALSGGTINGTAIGGTTPAAGAFTTLGATGAATLAGGGTLTGAFAGSPTFTGSPTFQSAATVQGTLNLGAGGTGDQRIQASGTGNMVLALGGASAALNVVSGNAGAPSLLQVGGSGNNVAVKTQLTLPGRTWAGTSISNNANLLENSVWSGTSGTSNASLYLKMFQTQENITAGATGCLDAFYLHNITTSGFSGQRQALEVVQAVTGSPGRNQDISAINAKVNLLSTFGGTAPDEFGAAGSAFGFNPVVRLGATATNIRGIVGVEINTWAEVGSSYLDRIGMQIVDVKGETYGVRPTRDDVMISLNNQYAQSGSLGYKHGIEFGRYGGYFPLLTTGTLIGAQNNRGAQFTADYGIDFRRGAFNKAVVAYPNAALDNSGNLQLGVAWLKPTASGLTIDPTGSVGASATVATGGSGFPAVPVYFTDPYGGVWFGGTPASGVVTAVTMVKAPYVSGATPSNPIALTGPDGCAGSGVTINVTWTTGTTVAVQGAMTAAGPLTFSGAGTVTLPSWTAAPANTVGLVGYNSATGRYDFGIGTGIVNHVRLTGDTMTGALTLSAAGTALSVANNATVSGVLTLGPASGGTYLTNKTGNNNGLNIQVTAATAGVNLWSGGTQVAGFTQSTSTINNTLVLNPTPVTSATAPFSRGINMNQTWTGDAGETGSTMNLITLTDNTTTTAPGGSTAFTIQQIMNSTSASGTRTALGVVQTFNSPTANIKKIYSTALFTGRANSNDNGDATNWGKIGSGSGSITTLGSYSLLNNGATYWHGVAGYEMDLAIYAGASAAVKQGMLIVLLANDASQGAWIDCAMMIGNQYNQKAGLGWRTGIMFGNDTSAFPMDPTGTMIGAGGATSTGRYGQQAGYGIDFLLPTFSKALFRSKQFLVDGSGALRQGSGSISYSGSGLSVDVNYLHGLAEGATITGAGIVSGGTSGFAAGDLLYDAFNGIYKVTAQSGGVITSVSVIRQSFAPVGTSATVPLTYTGTSLGVGTVSVTQTWATDTALSLQPSGGTTTVGGALAIGASGPTITSGAGAPSATKPNGSVYLRTDGTTGSRVYVSAGAGTWNAIAGV